MSAFNHMNSYLRFCVNAAQEHRISGKLFSQRLIHPLEFHDLGSLILFLEEVFDRQNYPQAFQNTRTLIPAASDMSLVAETPAQGMTPAVVRAARGTVTTFDVLVTSRRNSSWQGSVDWLDGGSRQEFTSFLALMRMIDERLFPDAK